MTLLSDAAAAVADVVVVVVVDDDDDAVYTDEEPIADYNETSIRYRGRANPSKTFRLLQSATGSDSDSGEFM